MKTMAPSGQSRPQLFAAGAFARIPVLPGIEAHGQKELDSRYATLISGNLHEGDLVSVTGWVQLIKTSADDCDYHIQITPMQDGSAGTIIVEIPEPDPAHVSDAQLRAQLAAERTLVREQLHLIGEPSRSGNKINGRAYMEFTGALFFDGPHFPNCQSRGEGTPAVTCWEVHPVVSSQFAPRPAGN